MVITMDHNSLHEVLPNSDLVKDHQLSDITEHAQKTFIGNHDSSSDQPEECHQEISADLTMSSRNKQDLIEIRKAHIAEIRRYKGLDIDSANVEDSHNITDLKAALDLLSDQLYSKVTHFILEVIQNADDNEYADSVIPTISFSEANGTLHIKCNERGFQPKNVEAICRIAQSTKKDRSKGFIGEKGIGFKSCFKVADIIWISSNHYSFRFDRNGPLGMIAPIWSSFPCAIEEDKTQFFLQLSSEKKDKFGQDVRRQLNRLDSTLLLFLRKLRQISISTDDGSATVEGRFIKQVFREDYVDHGGEMVRIFGDRKRLRRLEEDAEYFITRYTTEDMPADPMRRGLTSSEVVLAFPFKDGTPAFYPQKAYAFLPIRESGFRFLLQADFVLTANRQDIESSSPWNDRLLDALASCFLNAVTRCNSPAAKHLRYSWCGFLQNAPTCGVNDFAPLFSKLTSILKAHPVLECQDGSFQAPCGAFFVPPIYRDKDSKFLLLDHAVKLSYVSNDYEIYDPKLEILEQLGVEIMKPTRFLSLLKAWMDDDLQSFSGRPVEWHEALAHTLLEIADLTLLGSLPLVPLRDGRWVRINDGMCYFESGNATILGQLPEGIHNLLLVSMDATKSPTWHRFLKKLGVKELDTLEVCRLILALHNSKHAPDLPVDALIGHASYLFEANQKGVSATKPTTFWIHDINGDPRLSNTLYCDAPVVGCPQLGDLLPHAQWGSLLMRPAYLLHCKAKFLPKWIAWLEKYLGVKSVIRIVTTNGSALTSEFQYLVENADTSALLEVMLTSWHKDAAMLTSTTITQQLRAIQVLCDKDGTDVRCRLGQTCLPTPALKLEAVPGLHFLKLKDASSERWTKLDKLGVTVKPDLNFYMQCLGLVIGKGVPLPKITGLYKNIERLMLSKAVEVRQYFQKHAAIYVPSTNYWARSVDCVWDSTPGMQGEHALSNYYYELRSFFHDHLQIRNTSIEKVIKQLKEVGTSASNNLSTRKLLLFSLSEFLRRKPDLHNKLRGGNALEGFEVFPVTDGHDTIRLVSLNNPNWYICDRHDLEDSFRDIPGVVLAAFEVEDYYRLDSLCSAIRAAWPPQQHRLSAKVKEDKDFGTSPVFNASITTFVRSKGKYLRRIVRTACGSGNAETRRKLDALHKVNVYHSHNMSIKTTLNRGALGASSKGRAMKAEVIHKFTQTELQIYVAEDQITKSLCSALALGINRACEIGQDKLQMLVMEVFLYDDERQLHDKLHRAHVEGYDEEAYQPLMVSSDITTNGNALSTPENQTNSVKSPLVVGQAPLPLQAPKSWANMSTRSVDKAAPTKPETATVISKSITPTLNDTAESLSKYAERNVNMAAKPPDLTVNLGLSSVKNNVKFDIENSKENIKPTLGPAVNDDQSMVEDAIASKSKKKKLNTKIRLNLAEMMAEGDNGVHTSNTATSSVTMYERKEREYQNDDNTTSSHPVLGNSAEESGIHRQFARSSKRRNSPEKQESSVLTNGKVIPGRPAVRIAHYKSEKEQQREREIGLTGELYVWNVLKDVFGGTLSETCWTSELRSLAGEDFTSWVPEDPSAVYCDFTLHDIDGLMIKYFHKEKAAFLPQGFEAIRGLTFHIEVKSTPNSRREPFHLSRNQMNKFNDLTNSTTDVVVLFRVYELRSATEAQCAMYWNPGKIIESGYFNAQSKEYLVQEAYPSDSSDGEEE